MCVHHPEMYPSPSKWINPSSQEKSSTPPALCFDCPVPMKQRAACNPSILPPHHPLCTQARNSAALEEKCRATRDRSFRLMEGGLWGGADRVRHIRTLQWGWASVLRVCSSSVIKWVLIGYRWWWWLVLVRPTSSFVSIWYQEGGK